MATKKAKKAAPKKAAPKKKVKKAAAKKAAPVTRSITFPVVPAIPIKCIRSNGRWFCMKEEDGAFIQFDGPFATRKECEAHLSF